MTKELTDPKQKEEKYQELVSQTDTILSKTMNFYRLGTSLSLDRQHLEEEGEDFSVDIDLQ